MKYYLAGPMSGIKHHNIPAFDSAAETLRAKGYDIISPAELDGGAFREIAYRESPDVGGGDTVLGNTWGDLLARDVKTISDDCGGIILLPGWEKSKGARLEAFVALSCGYPALEYEEGEAFKVRPSWVMKRIEYGLFKPTSNEERRHGG